MKQVLETFDPALAEKVALTLTDQGFRCEVIVEARDGFDACAIVVPEADFDRASVSVEELVARIGEEESGQHCTRCGSKQVNYERVEGRNSFILEIHQFRCSQCGFMWAD